MPPKDDDVIREPINRGKAATSPAPDRQDVVREAIVRPPPAAAPAATVPENYGFTGENLFHNAKEGLFEMGRGGLQLAKDVAFSEGRDKSGTPQYGAGALVGMTPEGDWNPLNRASFLFDRYIGDPAKAEARTSGAYAGKGEYLPSIVHGVASLVPGAGPWGAGLYEQARTGDVGGALAKGGTQVLAGEILPKVAGETVSKGGKIVRGLQKLGEMGDEAPPAAPPSATPRPLPDVRTPATAPARTQPLPKVTPTPLPEPPISLGTRPATAPGGLPQIRQAEEGAPVSFGSRQGAGGALEPIAPAEPSPLKSLKNPEGNVTLSEEGKPGLKPIERPSLTAIVDQATGNKPLERNKPLRELKPSEAPMGEEKPVETDPIKIKYPDPAVRKFVRANGEKLVDAVGKDTELLQKIHDLKNVDVRQAAINAGIDLGTKHVGSKGELGPEQVSRQELLNQILDKGVKPADILELAKAKEEAPAK